LALLDARSAPEFNGTTQQEQLPRFGHIPGARHLEWTETLNARDLAEPRREHTPFTARFKDRAELVSLFRAAGADPGDEVVTYCTVGMRASELYFVARLLGYRAHLYFGSMADWSARSELPVVGPKQ